jgi:hypothetical protein
MDYSTLGQLVQMPEVSNSKDSISWVSVSGYGEIGKATIGYLGDVCGILTFWNRDRSSLGGIIGRVFLWTSGNSLGVSFFVHQSKKANES